MAEAPRRRGNGEIRTLLKRAEKAAPGAFRAPAYPIILSGRRYLITGALAGGYTNAARITNHTIQRLLAERAG